MGVKIPNKIKVTLTKADTDIATTGGLKGYFYVVNGSALFRSSDKVETVRISVPKYANRFYFRGGSTFRGPDVSTIISAEFLFIGANDTLIDHWKQDEVLLSYSKEFTIPEGTVTIYAPHITSMEATMRFGYEELDVTDGVMNIDELQISMSRDGASAVFVSSELPTQFARKSLGYNLLVTEFANRGIRAKISLKVYQRSPFAKPTYVYTPVISAAVDFSSYKQYRNYVEVSCEDATLNQLILSNGSNDYDILVSDLQTEGFTWDDLKTPQTGKIERLPQGKITGVYGVAYVADRINVIETSVTHFPNAEPFVLTNQAGGRATYGAQFFYQREAEVANPEPTPISVSMNNRVVFKFTVNKSEYDKNWDGKDADYMLESLSVSAYLSVIQPDGLIVNMWDQSDVRPRSIRTVGDSYVLMGSIIIDTVDIGPANYPIAPGDKLAFYTVLVTPQLKYSGGPVGGQDIIFTYEETQVAGDPAIVSTPPVYPAGRLLRAINPQVLLQKFLDRMADQPGRYKATINWRQDEATDYRLRLLAAESIAGYKKPYLHGNIKDFMNWMRVMGYEYEITGNEIIYRPREQFYTTEQMLDLTEAQLNDLTISPATNVLYATVKVGYEKQDYNDDYLDGLEANALFQYGTGIDALEGDMDLTSPYRADAIGIQLLYRDPETGETESDQRDNPDEDIFVVVLNKTGDNTVYTTVTLDVFDQLSGTYLKLPNALVSAPYMVRYNASVIGISTSRLTFASTTGNKDAKIEEVPINADITITEQLFKPVLYEFEAGADKEFPVTTGLLAGCGAVAFTWQGKTLRGFVKDIIRDVVDSEAVTWQLYAIDTPTL